jgi:hypothetical protein
VAWQRLAREARQARPPTLTVPARGAPLHPQVGTKERPPGTNKGTVQSQEAIDDLINTLTRRALREDETTMEDRSSRRVRTLVTRKARRGPSANEIACALISMMARSTCSNQRPNTLMQDRISQRRPKPLAPHGRTIHSGHSLPKWDVRATSAFPLIATEERTSRDVSKVPSSNSCTAAKIADLFDHLRFCFARSGREAGLRRGDLESHPILSSSRIGKRQRWRLARSND